jgi:uncharacterized repeat protein (TIGR01451 family)
MKKLFYLIFLVTSNVVLSQNSHKFDWVKMLSGNSSQLYDVKLDNSNNIIVSGGYTGSINVAIKGGSFILTDTQPFTYFLAKYNQNADLLWAINTSSEVSVSSFFSSIDLNSNNEIIYTDSKGTFNKYTTEGLLVWSQSLNQCNDLRVKVDNLDNIIISGELWTSQDFDFSTQTNILTSNGGSDIFIAKYDNNAAIQWAFNIGNNTSNYINDIEIDNGNNILITGPANSTVSSYIDDFNPGAGVSQTSNEFFVAKYDSNGNYLWVKSIDPEISDLDTDVNGNVFITGGFIGIEDFNPSAAVYNLTGTYSFTSDSYFLKLNPMGNFVLAVPFAGSLSGSNENGSHILMTSSLVYLLEERAQDLRLIILDTNGVLLKEHYYSAYGPIGGMAFSGIDENNGDVLLIGEFSVITQYSIFSDDYTSVNINGENNSFIIKLMSGYTGKLFKDFNNNGVLDPNEMGIKNQVVQKLPNEEIFVTDSLGLYFIHNTQNIVHTFSVGNLPNYSLTTDPTQTFSVSAGDQTLPNFGYYSNNPCNQPEISINAPILRRCMTNVLYISACNEVSASGVLDASYVDLELDPLITINSANLPFLALGNNVYRFQTGNINPGQCVNFQINANVSCNTLLGQTLCMNANLYPVELCVLDTIPSPPIGDGSSGQSGGALDGIPVPCTLPWDQSSLTVDGWCQNDSIYFYVENHGSGDMDCYAPVTIAIDGVVTYTDSILLVSGQGITYSFAGTGETWILNAEQHPLHPGCSHPNAHVEACGGSSFPSPGSGCINDFRLDDADPVVDIYCGVVTGSYDPNDKTGYPNGYTDQHYINPNQQLQYVIRFQNTGNDTAFTVVIRDTLDYDLNIFTVTPGVASHPYEFRMYGPRVLEWTFNNILLPDSTTNLEGSNGFVTYHVEQVPDLAPGTVIHNKADIYFDFNDPITTNETWHTIYDGFFAVAGVNELDVEGTLFKVYPNPVNGQLTIEAGKTSNERYVVYDQIGKKILFGKLSFPMTTIDASSMNQGIYFIQIGENKSDTFKIVKL